MCVVGLLLLVGLVFRPESSPPIVLTYPAASSLTNDLTPTIRGRAEAAERGDVTVTLYTGTDARAPAQELETELDDEGDFSVTASHLDPGVYTVEAAVGPEGATARTTLLVWRLGRVSDDAAVAPGTLEGVSLVPARDGSPAAALFDDRDDRIAVLSSPALNPSRWASMGAWVRQTRSGGWQNVVAKPGTGELAGQAYALWIDPDGNPVAFFGNGGSQLRVEAPQRLDGSWHQLAASYDGDAARIYVDGMLADERPGQARLVPNGLPVLIGRGGETEDRRAFTGLLADVWFSTRPLSSRDARRLYAQEVVQFRSSTPTVVLTSPERTSHTTDPTPAFAGSASTGALDRPAIEVRLYRGRSASGAPLRVLAARRGAAGSWSVSARSPLPTGTYTVQAVQASVTSEVGRSAAATFTVVQNLSSAGPLLAGAGDIADCTDTGHVLTAELLAETPDAKVQTFGDNAYPHGSPSNFDNCYGRSWGAAKERTNPAIGDHEYETRGASGYFGYFAERLARFAPSARDPARAYYSYDLGTWHVVVLNASCSDAPGCSVERQLGWLEQDLLQHESRCTLAVLHSPRWSSGDVHRDNPGMQGFWKRLYDAGTDVVVGGDEHVYERYAPQDPRGAYDPLRGLRQLTVGTGGGSLYGFEGADANSEVRYRASYGILRLALLRGGYEWQFVAADPTRVVDGGSDRCH
jgi:Concanavalin A-like lectin/glucanases superfamily